LIVAVDQEGYLPTPDEHAGYWALSAPLDGDGNTVIVGHNRTSPVEVFRNLPRVEVGDEIILIDQFNAEYRYEVTEVELFQVDGNPEEAQRTLDYIDPELSKRVTLITCQPEGECTQRLIVVAVPADE
ncbi:MAG TPA: sortase, partial [Aggregatilineales bacterium]|nr:sortase [Aggregatilineales bacterium]